MITIAELALIEGTTVPGLRNRTSIDDLPFSNRAHYKKYGPTHLMALSLQRELIAQSLQRRETALALQGVQDAMVWLVSAPEGGGLLFFKYHESGESTVGAVVGRKDELQRLIATSCEASSGASVQLVLVDAERAWRDATERARQAGFDLRPEGIEQRSGVKAA